MYNVYNIHMIYGIMAYVGYTLRYYVGYVLPAMVVPVYTNVHFN